MYAWTVGTLSEYQHQNLGALGLGSSCQKYQLDHYVGTGLKEVVAAA